MADSKVTLEMDYEAEAAYIRLGDEAVSVTEEVEPHVMVDLDEYRVVVGVEILGFSTPIPFTRLREYYHVRSEVIEKLRQIQPTIEGFVSMTMGYDGSMSLNRQLSRV